MIIFKRILYIMFILFQTSLLAVPTASTLLKEQREEEQKTIQKKPSKPILKTDDTSKFNKSSIKIKVKEFILIGDITIFNKTYIQALIKPNLNKTIGIKQLYNVLDIIKNIYKSKGYFTIKVFFPKQDITTGIVTIKIIESKIEPSKDGIQIISQDSKLSSLLAYNIVTNHIKKGKVLNKNKLERAILLLNDIPATQASLNLKKGSIENTTRVLIDIKQNKISNPYISFNNNGSRSTGAYKLVIGNDFKNLSPYGDELKLNFTNSFSAGKLQMLSSDYSSLLGSHGLRAGIKANLLDYKVGKEYETLNLNGRSISFGFYTLYPIIKQKQISLSTKISYDISNLEDKKETAITNKKSVKTLRLSSIINKTDTFYGGGYNSFDFTIHNVNTNIKDLSSYTSDQANTGERTNGHGYKVSFTANRIQSIDEKTSLKLNTSGQYAFSNLDSSEKFSLGGASGVRAYPTSEASGNHGLKISLTANYKLSNNLKFIGFYDWGKIKQYVNEYEIAISNPSSYSLKGYGVGLNFFNTNGLSSSITYAKKHNAILSNADGTKDNGRFWFNLRKGF